MSRFFGAIAQNGYVVRDIHAAMDHWSAVLGVTFRTRNPEEITRVIAGATRDLLPAMSEGVLTMPIDRVYGFEEAARALERMATNQHFGKIVLSLSSR